MIAGVPLASRVETDGLVARGLTEVLNTPQRKKTGVIEEGKYHGTFYCELWLHDEVWFPNRHKSHSQIKLIFCGLKELF